jgi:hypothetical protein
VPPQSQGGASQGIPYPQQGGQPPSPQQAYGQAGYYAQGAAPNYGQSAGPVYPQPGYPYQQPGGPYYAQAGPPPVTPGPPKKSRKGLVIAIVIVAIIAIIAAVVYAVFLRPGSDPTVPPATGSGQTAGPGQTTNRPSDTQPIILSSSQFERYAQELNDTFIKGDVDIYPVSQTGGCGAIAAPDNTYEAEYDSGDAIGYGYLELYANEQETIDFLASRVACWNLNGNDVTSDSATIGPDSSHGVVASVTVYVEGDKNPYQFVRYGNIMMYYTGGAYATNPQGLGEVMRDLAIEMFG